VDPLPRLAHTETGRQCSLDVHGNPECIEVLIGHDFEERTYPFELKPGGE
jgi:hypothetical protein